MKILFLSSILSFFLFSIQCDKDDPKSEMPECLKDKIAILKKEDCPSVSRVLQYQFQGEIVYVIYPKSCGADLTREILDQDCKTICYLDGIAGKSTCNGVIFADQATGEKQVYP